MRATLSGIVTLCVLAFAPSSESAPKAPDAVTPTLGGSVLVGYGGGTGAQVSLTAADFARELPFTVRLGVGYQGLDPGNPLAARANFINDNTNGTPEESGHIWDFRFDFLVPVRWFDFGRTYLVFGPRHARFSDFLHSSRRTHDYLNNLRSGSPQHYLGHNPAGGWMVLMLLSSLLATAASGMLIGTDHAELWEDLHEGFANFTLLLIFLHLGGVLLSSLLHRENLIGAMWSGMKKRRNADV